MEGVRLPSNYSFGYFLTGDAHLPPGFPPQDTLPLKKHPFTTFFSQEAHIYPRCPFPLQKALVYLRGKLVLSDKMTRNGTWVLPAVETMVVNVAYCEKKTRTNSSN